MAKTMGVGPITGTIYYGTVKNDRWVGNREDVTDIAIRSVFEWFMCKFKAECREGEAYQVKFPSVPYVLEMRIEAEPSKNNQLSRDEQSNGFISKQKLCNYIQAQLNPYGRPFEGTAYEFGLKIMDYIKNCSCDEEMEELKQYRDLEEQGLLLRLPCKVGDAVYYILGIPRKMPCIIEKASFELSDIDKIGKTLFLTQSEAEEKLRDLEGRNGEEN